MLLYACHVFGICWIVQGAVCFHFPLPYMETQEM